MTQLPLVITCGDPAGVGPETTDALLRQAASGGLPPLIVAGHPRWIASLRGTFPALEAIEVGGEFHPPRPGNPTEDGARIALAAMEAAADACVAGRARGVVTGPVSKAWLKRIGYALPGQTEFFAERWGGDPTMAFAGGRLRVVLATWHIPFSAVPAALTPACLALAVERAALLAGRLGATRPRIAVCGLNPHAGEDGLMGDDEREHIDPVLDSLRARHPGLSRTLPADTVFWRQLKGDFDVVVALYHDQGLAPLKTLEFDRAVNITLGLPWIRTSPDHGTAFDIAGRGVANHGSLAEAVRLADRLAQVKE